MSVIVCFGVVMVAWSKPERFQYGTAHGQGGRDVVMLDVTLSSVASRIPHVGAPRPISEL
jgi:hypothetical protein